MSSQNRQKKDPDSKSKKKNRCSTCKRGFGNEKFLRCSVCLSFFQCLECYSIGYCSERHAVNHTMLVMDSEPDDGYTSDWNANEELLLLYGIKTYGIGNWPVISDFIGTKSALQAQIHYFAVFCDGSEAPYPPKRLIDPIPLPPPPNYKTTPRESLPSERSNRKINKTAEYQNCAEYSGYMPYRNEFEHEYNQNAEDIISMIDFTNVGDSESIFSAFCQSLSVYNEQLSERHFRTKIIEEWDIHHLPNVPGDSDVIDSRFLSGETPAEKAIDMMVLPLSQYFDKNKIVTVADALHKKEKILQQLNRFRSWIENGIKDQKEGELFDALNSVIESVGSAATQAKKWNAAISSFSSEIHEEKILSASLLTDEEICLCNSSNIPIEQYNVLKDLILREGIIRGSMTKSAIKQMCYVEDSSIDAIIDHFSKKGWISVIKC